LTIDETWHRASSGHQGTSVIRERYGRLGDEVEFSQWAQMSTQHSLRALVDEERFEPG
jgi:hypothetical protein